MCAGAYCPDNPSNQSAEPVTFSASANEIRVCDPFCNLRAPHQQCMSEGEIRDAAAVDAVRQAQEQRLDELQARYQTLAGDEIRSVSSTGGEKGTKLARYDLIPVGPLRQVAEHYGKGAAKYADHNWRRGYEWSKSYAALMRHATQFWGGEDVDEETGSHHMAAVAFHALALLEYAETHPDFDDRYRAVVQEPLADWEAQLLDAEEILTDSPRAYWPIP